MTPSVDETAREAVNLALGFADRMTFARLKSHTPEERQAAAVKAMLCLALFEDQAAKLKAVMPRSTEDGFAIRRDLREIA